MNSKTIIHIGTLYAKPEHTNDLIKSFEGLKQAPGYISHECYQDVENERKLTLVEKWQSKEDHENFVQSFSEEAMKSPLCMNFQAKNYLLHCQNAIMEFALTQG